jgi:hypothetical protein
MFKLHVRIALGCKDFNPAAWKALPVGDAESITPSEDKKSSGVGRARQEAVPQWTPICLEWTMIAILLL